MPQAHYLKAVLLHFFVIWLLYGIKRLTAGLVLSDDAFADFMREPSPLPDNRQVERRAQPSLPLPVPGPTLPLPVPGPTLPVAGNRDRWPTEDRHTFHDINKLSLQQRERADAREAITHEMRDAVAAVRRNRERSEISRGDVLTNTKLLQTQLAADPKNALKQRALYDQIRRNWASFGWTRQHPFIGDLIREDLPENENILEVPRGELLNRIGYNPISDRSPQELMVAIGVVDQAHFDVWLAEPSGQGVPFRQDDLYDLVRMRSLDIAQHVPGWGSPLNRDAYNRMFPEGKRTLAKFERTPIDQEILRHAQMGANIYQESIASDIAEMRSRSRAGVPAPSPPAPLPPSVQTIKYIDDPDGTIEAD